LEIKPELKLQRDAVKIVVPQVVSLRKKTRKLSKTNSPQPESENTNKQLWQLEARAEVRASSQLLD
jgi:hypothetical protein